MFYHAEASALPLENLPERSTPTPRGYTAHFLNIRPETQEMLDKCDWSLYESTVTIALEKAVKRYNGDLTMSEEIYQVSIATDPQRQITEISFETRPHAEAVVRGMVKWLHTRLNPSDRYLVEKLEADGFNPNPVEFLFPNYYTILHRELKPLAGIDYDDAENRTATEVWIETSLLKVVERVRHLKLLVQLPQKEGIWLGVNSPRARYDHVTKI